MKFIEQHQFHQQYENLERIVRITPALDPVIHNWMTSTIRDLAFIQSNLVSLDTWIHFNEGKRNIRLLPSSEAAPINAYMPGDDHVPLGNARWTHSPNNRPIAAPHKMTGTNKPLGTYKPYVHVASMK